MKLRQQGNKQKIGGGILIVAVCALFLLWWVNKKAFDIPPDDPLYKHQSNLQAVGIEAAWAEGYTGKGVRIALLDTGVSRHEDLNEKRIQGKSYVEEEEEYSDTIGHGTFIAGMLAAELDNGSGMAGMTRSDLVVLKVVDGRSPVSMEDVAQAVRDAWDLYKCEVISISMGTPNPYGPLEEAIDYVSAQGVIVIAACGGDEEQAFYPAAYEAVIGVDALDEQLEAAAEGAGNDSVFVTAPGQKLIGPDLFGGYTRTGAGASYATAHVTALAAFAKEQDRSITTAAFQELLKESVQDAGEEGYDHSYGWGVIDVEAYIEKLKEHR